MNDPGTPIYTGMVGGYQVEQPTTPPPVNPQPNLDADVQAQISAAISAVEAKYADRITALENQLKDAQSVAPSGPVAEHAAGPGYEVAPSWGQWHQELSRAGKLTEEILATAGYAAKVV